jgi:3-hydroxymyristoyl/3-hydroxydecanoyl-(acyl carrier protein) dehydratase
MSLPEGASVWSAFRPASPHALLPALLAPLRAGCRVVGGPVGDLETLAAELGARSVHTLVAPASLARALSRRAAPLPASLRQIVVAGEALDGPSSTQLGERGLRVLAVPSLAPTPADAARAELLDLLLGNPDVADAAVEVVHLPDGPHALCVVAAPPGREEELRTVLAARMDSSLQVATALPRDPDGTLARERLLRLFGRNANGRLPSQRLLFRESTPDGVRTFRTKVPADFFGFEGHFPPYPVLSGAVQLHELVLPCVRAEIGEGVETAGFQDLKFLARIAPGDTVVVAVRRDHVRGTCDFEITRGTVKCSTGRVLLRGAGHRP